MHVSRHEKSLLSTRDTLYNVSELTLSHDLTHARGRASGGHVDDNCSRPRAPGDQDIDGPTPTNNLSVYPSPSLAVCPPYGAIDRSSSRVSSLAQRFFRRAVSAAGGGGSSCGNGGGDVISTFGNNGSIVGYEALFDSSPTCMLRGEWPGNAAEQTEAGHERIPSNSPRPTPPTQVPPR